MLSSRGSSQPRDRIHFSYISCIEGGFFTTSTTWKAPIKTFCCSLMQSCLTLVTPWTSAHQASLSVTISPSLLKLMSIELVMPSNYLIVCHPLVLLTSILYKATRGLSRTGKMNYFNHYKIPLQWEPLFIAGSNGKCHSRFGKFGSSL